ncbi:MAG TPA: hypothetical protein VIV11_34790 [Kofleriaceae bacterium]
MRTWLLAVAIAALGCSGGYPDPKPNRPNAPTTNDPAFTSRGLESWYLIGDAATPGEDQLTFIITAPSGTDFVDAYIPGLPPQRLIDQSDGFALDISIATLEAGAHEVLFSANGSDDAFAKTTLNRSTPYYVLVSTDYDFADPGNLALGYMDKMHMDHPGLVMTHFWPPYTYTDPMLAEPRREELNNWIKKQRDTHKDEIGLHIHPYCHFVEAAGQTCITDQSTVYTSDTSGYTIKLSAYARQPMGALLQHAATIFNQRGLGTPRTFRAGGWTADLQTLLALADNGYVADTSALNWMHIEEWLGKELYTWNMTHWGPINDTSQPYYPSLTDPLTSSPGNNIAMLEVPDNGVMIDYLSTPQMKAIFDANWDGAPLAAPKTLMMGFHPSPSFSDGEYRRVDDFLELADMHSASKDLGPVVYISLFDVTKAFPAE